MELESGGTADSLSSELAAGHEVINHQGSSRKEPGSRVVSQGRGRKTSKSEAAVPIGNHYLSRPKGEMTGPESHWSSYVQLCPAVHLVGWGLLGDQLHRMIGEHGEKGPPAKQIQAAQTQAAQGCREEKSRSHQGDEGVFWMKIPVA